MIPETANAYIGLGSNEGDCAGTIRKAIDRLSALPRTALVATSSLYHTPPWGKTDQPSFVNAVARLATALTPQVLLSCCMEIEASLGRVRHERWGQRTIDLDLLFMDGVRMATPTLTVPHPYLTRRAFVLVPLAEIAPDLEIDGFTVSERLELLGHAAELIKKLEV